MTIVAVVEAVLFLLIGLIVVVRNYRNTLHVIFFILCVFMSGFLLSFAVLFSSSSVEVATMADRIFLFFGVNSISSMAALALVFHGNKTHFDKRLIPIFAVSIIIGAISLLTDWDIQSASIVGGKLIENKGFFDTVWNISVICYTVLMLFFFIRNYRYARYLRIKKQLRIIFVALGASLLIAVLFSMILPEFGILFLFEYGVILGSSISLGTIAYIMFSQNMVERENVFKKLILWTVSSAFVFIPIILFFQNSLSLWQQLSAPETLMVLILIGAILSIYYDNARHLINKLFRQKYIDREKLQQEFIENILSIKNTNELLEKIQQIFNKEFYIKDMMILLSDKEHGFYLPKNPENKIQLSEKLVGFLLRYQDTLEEGILEELDSASADYSEIQSIFSQYPYQLIIPIIFTGELIGIIFLKKASKLDQFSQEELYFFRYFRKQFAIALNNSLLYNNLESIIEKNTQELVKRNLALEYTLSVNENNMNAFKSINELSRLLISVKYYTMSEFYKVLGEIFPGFINIETVLIYEVDKNAGLFKLVSQHHVINKHFSYPETLKIELGNTFGETYQSQKPEVIDYVNNLPQEEQYFFKKLGVRKSLIIIPIKKQSETIGILVLMDKINNDSFDKEDLFFINSISYLVHSSLEKVLMFEDKLKGERYSIIGQMAASIVHDIKNPITGIKGLAECLAAPEFTKEDRFRFIDTIIEETNRLYDMTAEILDFTKGDFILNMTENSIPHFIDAIKSYLDSVSKIKNITIITNIHYKNNATFDFERLKRVIYNIAQNAFDVMEENDTFEITVSKKKNTIVFGLKDNGPGIPESIRNTLFEPFVTQGKKTGTGLGLAIAKKVMEKHNGIIRYETASGIGTTFFLEFPIKQ